MGDFGWTGSADGSRLADPPFDIDGDGVFDLINDSSGTAVPPSGIKSKVGAPSAPAIVQNPDGSMEYKIISGTDGSTQSTAEAPPPAPPTTGVRESWQQLR